MARSLFSKTPMAMAAKTVFASGLFTAATNVRAETEIAPDPQLAAEQAVQLQAVEITADRITSETPVKGYKAEVSKALGFDLSTQELPGTVNIVTADFLQDSGARKLNDITAYIPGVSHDETRGGNTDNFVVRGFGVGNINVNGIRQVYSSQRHPLDTIERVEVIKGADGVESAAADPGGSINLVTKKPQKDFAAEASLTGGDFSYRKLAGDVTGTLLKDGSVQGRLIAAYEEGGLWRPAGAESSPFVVVAPSVKWDYAPGGSLLVELQHVDASSDFDRGVAYLPGAFEGGFAPRDWSENTRYDNIREKTDSFDLDLKQRINSVLSARLHSQQTRSRYGGGQLEALLGFSDVYAEDGVTWNGNRVIDQFLYGQFSGGAINRAYVGELKAAFEVLGIKQELIGGLAYNSAYQTYSQDDSRTVMLTTDVLHPDNDLMPGLDGNVVAGFSGNNRERIKSGYGQWLSRWTPRWRTVISARYDDIQSLALFRETPDAPLLTDADFGDSSVALRLASSFDLNTSNTVFAGYSTAHFPQNAITRSGKRLKPVGNIGYEMGLKTTLVEGRLLWTNTLFRNGQQDVSAADPANLPGEPFAIPFGDVQVQGFESQLSGQPITDLDMTAGLSLQQSKVKKAEDASQIGKRFKNTPRQQFSTFASYRWAGFGVPQLSTRLGVIHVGAREGNDANSFKLPSYTRFDGGLSWRYDSHITLDVNVENLLDKTYYNAADGGGLGGGTVSIGNRRLANATVRYAF